MPKPSPGFWVCREFVGALIFPPSFADGPQRFGAHSVAGWKELVTHPLFWGTFPKPPGGGLRLLDPQFLPALVC